MAYNIEHVLLLTVLFTVVNSNYTVPGLKHEILSDWTLTEFSALVREAVLSAVPFPWETVEQILDSSEEIDIIELGQEVIIHELPLLVPSCLGLLLAVLVPLITVLFCCCRCCCGCCGAKLKTEDVRKHNRFKMVINAFVVLTTVGILSAMAGCIPVSGDRLKTSPRMVFRTINASLDDLPLFLDKFVNDASDVAIEALNTAIDDIKSQLDDLPDILAEPVTDGAKPYVDKIENNINIISNDIDSLGVTEIEVNATVDAMLLHSNDLQTGLSNINGLYVTIKSDCVDDGKTFCNTLPDGDGADALNISIDNSKLTEIAEEVTKLVAEAVIVNLTEFQTLGNTTFEEIPKTVRNASQDAVDTVKSTLDTVQGDLEPQIDSALEAARFDLNLSDSLEPLDENIKMLEENDQIVGAVFKAFGGVLGIIALTALVGLLLGVLFTKKPITLLNAGRTRAGHCGASLLMMYIMSVCLAVLPLLLILLIGSVFMLLGGNLTVFCAPLQDLTVFTNLVDSGLLFGGESLGAKFFNDSSLNLSVAYLFRTCRGNGTVYSGLNLDSVMNLSSILNADEFVPDLGDDVVGEINDTIRDISIVNTSQFDDLKSKLQLSDMDANTASNIQVELNSLDLPAITKEIDDLADTIPDQFYADRYRAISTGLRDLHTDTKVPLQQLLNDLTMMIEGLNDTSQKMKTIITTLSTDLDDLSHFVETQAVAVIIEALEDFLNGMSSVADDLVNTTLDALRTDVGQCKILADVYDTVIASICVHFLDAFNVLWASFYTGGIVCTVLMVASCTVSKYFRQPDDFVQVRHRVHENLTMNANPLAGMADVVLTKYTSFGESDRNNNAIFPRQNYRRIHQKWKQKRTFITGPFSAQFFGQGSLKGKQIRRHKTAFDDLVNCDENRSTSDCISTIDSSVDGSPCISHNFPSLEGMNSQEGVIMIDENQNFTNPTERIKTVTQTNVDNGKINENEIRNISQNEEQTAHPVSNEDNCQKNSVFPYLRLTGDEFILLPGATLKTESFESIDNSCGEKIPPTSVVKHASASDGTSLCNSDWLRSYTIDSNIDNAPSSPLVKYSDDNLEMIEKLHQSYTANESVPYVEPFTGHIKQNGGGTRSCEDVTITVPPSENSVGVLKGKTHVEFTNLDDFPLYQVVCSLCRKNVSKNQGRKNDVSNKSFFNKPYCTSMDSHPREETVHSGYAHSYVDSFARLEPITNRDIGKISKSLEESLHMFDNTFEELTERRVNTCNDQTHVHQQERSGGSSDKRRKHVSRSKLDIKVKPYKPLKKMKSPRSAFLFWKYVESNCNGLERVTWPRVKPLPDGSNQTDNSIVTEGTSELHAFDGNMSSHESSNLILRSESETMLPPRKVNGQQTRYLEKQPDALQDLAIAAGRLAHVREEASKKSECQLFKFDIHCDQQPQSLSNIAIAVAAGSGVSHILQRQEGRFDAACTTKNNTQISYV